MSRSRLGLGILGLTILGLAVAFAVMFSSGPAGMALAPEPPGTSPTPITTTTDDFL